MCKPRRNLREPLLKRQVKNQHASQLGCNTLTCMGYQPYWCCARKVNIQQLCTPVALALNSLSILLHSRRHSQPACNLCIVHRQSAYSETCHHGTAFSTFFCSNPVLHSSCALPAAGRMGDTFPHTFTCQDQRLRSGAKYSVLVQELGRLCRYPTVHNSQKLPKLISALSQTGVSSRGRLYLLEQVLHKAYGTEHWQGMSAKVAHDTILYVRVCMCMC